MEPVDVCIKCDVRKETELKVHALVHAIIHDAFIRSGDIDISIIANAAADGVYLELKHMLLVTGHTDGVFETEQKLFGGEEH